MKTSDAIDQLFTALAAAQAEMPDAMFDRENPHFKSKYASLSSVRKATLPLHKHGIAVVHAKRFLDDGAYILETRLVHGKSGQWVQSEWPVAIGSPQSMGSSETYGKRYNLAGLTSVAADDDDDANAAQAAARNREDASTVALGDGPTLPKAKSRAIYDELTKEMRALIDRDALRKWWIESGPRRRTMHPDFQRWLLRDAENHETTIEVGADEEGNTVVVQIGDEIPEQEGSAA